MALKTVTLGSDGVVDYVETADGVRYSLGPVSILQVVRALVSGTSRQKQVLNRINRGGMALVSLDIDQLFEMLRPRPYRNASPLIPLSTMREEVSMQASRLEKNLRELELRADYLTKLASNGQENPRVWEDMRRLASTLLSAEEEQGQEQETQEQGQKQAQEQEPGQEQEEQEKTANTEVLKANSALAEGILHKLGETSSKITQLEKAGRKFNASRAQTDIHNVALQVEEILTQADLGVPWVGSALHHLASEADRLHGLFAPVKI